MSVSAGLKEVWREVMEDVGDCLLRIFDLVDLNFLRNLCGRIVGRVGHEIGNLLFVKKR